MSPRAPIDLAPPVERAFLLAVDTGADPGWTAEDSLAELAALADTAGADVVGAEWQNRRHVDPNWYVGKGKAEDLLQAKSETAFDILVADDELSPGQQRALEGLLNVKVIDRSRLILDIFALHAHTHEGRLQVELAQLEYQLPRLTRLWTHLSRTGGGIGTRGPGESQLETDRRLIRERIKKMKERVEDVRRQRETAARGRDRRLWPTVAIVGYTNAGKSTLLNSLVGSEVARAEDRLFATLDPTSRQVKLGEGQTAIVTDTVGFIHKLPHQLVDAFRATLEEVTRADVLLEVVDASDRHATEHRATVQAVLDELGAGDKPRLVALNKADLVASAATNAAAHAPIVAGSVLVSALTRLRARRAARRDRRAARVALGRRRRRRAVRRRGAARAGPGARHRGPRLPGARRAGPGADRAVARGRAAGGRGAVGRARDGRRRRVVTEAGSSGDRDPGPLRRAGTGRLSDGRRVVWTVAEGDRGRRWRSLSLTPGGRQELDLLLEAASDGAVTRLEATTRAGLLTLHPSRDGRVVHGNVATPAGMRHLELRWSPAHVLLVVGSIVTGAVAVRRLADRVGVGEGDRVPVVEVDRDLGVREATWRVARTAPDRWQLLAADGGAILTLEVDGDGCPAGLGSAAAWPLEIDGTP